MPTKKSAVAAVAAVPVDLPPIPVAIDLGNSETKIKYAAGQAINFRSIMAPLSDSNKMSDWPIDSCMFYGGQWWVSGEECDTLAPGAVQEDRTVNRYGGQWYKRLFAFALHRMFNGLAGVDPITPKITASIPAALYSSKAECQRVIDNLTGFYEIGRVDGAVLTVDVRPDLLSLVPEGFGAFAGLMYGPNGPGRYAGGLWMVLDVGYMTLDSIVIGDVRYMQDLSRSDENSGMSVVAEAVAKYVFEQSRVRIRRATVDRLMYCPRLTVNQKSIPIETVREAATAKLGDRISLLTEQWSTGLNLSGVILTGGGAAAVRPYLHDGNLPDFILPVDPRRANVDGVYLWLNRRG